MFALIGPLSVLADPTFTEILAAITGFVADYSVYVAAGAVAGLMFWGVSRLVKAGR